jgi:small GTP-binding protein
LVISLLNHIGSFRTILLARAELQFPRTHSKPNSKISFNPDLSASPKICVSEQTAVPHIVLRKKFGRKIPMEPPRRTSCKVVILGNSGVGKTSLVMQWTTGDYEAQIGPTIGANHQRKTITVQSEEVDLFLWDTAGQEQFQALTPLYAHSAATALIVVAIDDIDSFKGIPTWMDLLNRSCDKPPPMLLLVNKMDREERATTTKEDIKERYGSSLQALFFVSASTGEGVDPALRHAGELAYEFTLQTGNVSRRQIAQTPRDVPQPCC